MKKVLSLSFGVFLFFTSHVVFAQDYEPQANGGAVCTGKIPCGPDKLVEVLYTYSNASKIFSIMMPGIGTYNIKIGNTSESMECFQIDPTNWEITLATSLSYCANLNNNFQIIGTTGTTYNTTNGVIKLMNVKVITNFAGKGQSTFSTPWKTFKPSTSTSKK